MGPAVGDSAGNTIIMISDCDLDGFEAAHEWLTVNTDGVPALPLATSVICF